MEALDVTFQGFHFDCSNFKARDHSMYVSGLSCTSIGSGLVVICVVLSGYRFVTLLIHSGLLL